MIGRTLSHFEITAMLGEGGMGKVYRATDLELGRAVAIKVLPEAFAADEQRLARLRREARMISRLSHPNVCTLYELAEAEGIHFIVLEHLEGETLARRLERGSLSVGDTLRYGAQIADALAAAHLQGIVHRDLKPANVMLVSTGVKLLDFGIARSARPQDGEGANLPTMTMRGEETLTGEGTLLGTVRYMSPEQVEGGEADARSDIFALGAVLYEMAAGRPAFDGQSTASIMAAVLQKEVEPVSRAQPLTPPGLDRVIARCLAKDPEQRWQNARDVALELAWVGSRADERQPGPRRRERRWTWLGWAAAALLAVALLVVAGGRPRPETPPAPVVRARLPPPTGTEFDLEPQHPAPVVVAPDGSRLVFGAYDEAGIDRLFVRRTDGGEAHALAGTEGAGYPFWSPDGRQVGFFAGGELKALDLASGDIRTLCSAPLGKGGAWSRQGVVVFAPSFDSPLFRVSERGGDPDQLTELEGSGASHRFPVFLPDGRRFLYQVVPAMVWTGVRIELGDLDRSEPEVILTSSDSNAAYGSERLVFVRDGRLLAQPFDPDAGTLTGDPVRLAEDVHLIAGTGYGVFSISPNGVLVYQPAIAPPRARLVWLDRAGRELDPLSESGEFGFPKISPDARRVAVEVVAANGNADIRLYDVATGVATTLASREDHEFFPVWTPDGEKVVYAVRSATTSSLQLVSIRGEDDGRSLLEGRAHLFPWDVSPDGRYLLYGVSAEGSTEIELRAVAMPFSGASEPSREPRIPGLSSFSVVNRAEFSPDGRWIALTAVEGAAPYVYLVPFDRPGRAWKIWEESASQPRWGHDGRTIFLVTHAGEFRSVEVRLGKDSFQLGASELLFHLPGSVTAGARADPSAVGFDIAPGGDRFLLALPASERSAPPLTIVSDWRGSASGDGG